MLVGFQVSAALISYTVIWPDLATGLEKTEELIRKLPDTTFNLTVQYASPAGDLGPPQTEAGHNGRPCRSCAAGRHFRETWWTTHMVWIRQYASGTSGKL